MVAQRDGVSHTTSPFANSGEINARAVISVSQHPFIACLSNIQGRNKHRRHAIETRLNK